VPATILVVDDEPGLRKVLCGLLEQAKYRTIAAEDGARGLEEAQRGDVDLVIADLKMPGPSGIELTAALRQAGIHTPVIILTAHGTIAAAVEGMRRGAADFVTKPFDRDELLLAVRRALARPAAEPASPKLLGGSAALAEVRRLAARVAPTDSTVLIRGETGVGKEVVAQTIHAQSAARGGPFVKVVCAALPESLLEAELFGHEKGAFTGAVAAKPGRFELAEGGTIFLDEIGEIPPPTQVRLLRVLQDRQIERVGGVSTIRVTARVVAATNVDLEAAVREGRFRQDLFFRLNVFPITVPPLRERGEDVLELADAFLDRRPGKPRLAPEARARLRAYGWPGNVRELENVMERASILAEGPLVSAELVESLLSGPSAAGGIHEKLAATERAAVAEALKQAGGNRTRAARSLGVSRRTLYNKLHEHGLE
jgi:DNA-binding NtrC family response regulator